MANDVQEPGGEPERPDWLPDRFKDERELYNSYRELEGKMTREAQEKSSWRDEREELYSQLEEMQELLSQQQQPEPQYGAAGGGEEYSPLIAMYEQARDTGDIRQELMAHAALTRSLWERWNQEQQSQNAPQYDANAEAVSQLFALQTEQVLRSQVPDWDDIKEGVHDVIEQNPYLLSDTNEPLAAAQMVMNAAAIYRQQQADMAAQGGNPPLPEPSRQAKMQAQTMQGQGMHPGTEQTAADYWEQIKAQPTQGFKL